MTVFFKCCMSCCESQSSSNESSVQAGDSKEAQILSDPRTTQIAKESLSSAEEFLSPKQLPYQPLVDSDSRNPTGAKDSPKSVAKDLKDPEEEKEASGSSKIAQSSIDQNKKAPSDQLKKVSKDVSEGVNLSKKSRNKIYESKPGLIKLVEDFEKELDQLSSLANLNANICHQYNLLNSKSDQWEKQFDQIKKISEDVSTGANLSEESRNKIYEFITNSKNLITNINELANKLDQLEKISEDISTGANLSEESQNKIHKSKHGLEDLVANFEKKLDQLISLVDSNANPDDQKKLSNSEIKNLVQEIKSDFQKILEKVIEEIDDITERIYEKNKLDVSVKKLVQNCKDFNLYEDFFADWKSLDKVEPRFREISLHFLKEQLINRVLDNLFFLEAVNADIKRNKSLIVREFYGKLSEKEIESVTFELILHQSESQDKEKESDKVNPHKSESHNKEKESYKVNPYQSESHNKGKVPVKVIFRLNNGKSFNVFYKPRQALIDSKIIETLKNLNDLKHELESIGTNLFTYKILNLKSEDNSSFSLWEFIEGGHKSGQTAEEAIRSLFNGSQRKILDEQLLRAESIFSFLEVSDLHLDNIIFKDSGTNFPQLAFIDLESIQPGNVTGLYENKPKELPNFTEKESSILEESKKAITDIPFRFVSIPTKDFLDALRRCDSYLECSQKLAKTIDEKGFTRSATNEDLERLMLNDFLHNDIPYLTQHQSNLYYGSFEKGHLIAKKQAVS